jgi:hypothetical protein
LMPTKFRTSHWAHGKTLQVELANKINTFLPLTVVVRRILSPKQMLFCGDSPTNSIVKTFLRAGWSCGEEVTAYVSYPRIDSLMLYAKTPFVWLFKSWILSPWNT